MTETEMARLERIAEDLDRRIQIARKEYDADPTSERKNVVSQLRSEQRAVATRILELEFGNQP